MFSEKLLTLLATFSKYELNRFRKFLLSPYFNEQEEMIRLFDLCNSTIRKGEDALRQLDKHETWRLLYPNRKIDEAQLRRQASELTQLALKFLALEVWQKKSEQEGLDLQNALEKKQLTKHLAGAERQFLTYLNETPAQSAPFYLAGFQFHQGVFNRASKVVANASFMQNLLIADKFLDAFYAVQKLKFYISWLLYRGFRSTDEEISLMNGFWNHLKHSKFEVLPLIIVYEKVILSLTEPENEDHFHSLIENLQRFEDRLTNEDTRELYFFAQNYCAFKINQGKIEYYREVFEIFKNLIRKGILLEDGQLSEGVYKNIITASLGADEFVWAENFINQYSIFLPENIRENARTYNLASLYFNQKKYTKVIDLLQNVEYSDASYALSSKVLLLRTYFEINEFIVLDSLMDSFRIYVRRSKVLSKTLKRESNNFLNFLRKLILLHSKETDVFKLKKRVQETQSVISKKWVLEKIHQMENRDKIKGGYV